MPFLQVEGLEKGFSGKPVLKGVSFSVEEGDVIALLGPSGAGKSVLLRSLNLLGVPDCGKMRLDELQFDFSKPEQLTEHAIHQVRKRVGMVFQQFNLWPHKTVLENLILAPCAVNKVERQVAIKKAMGLLKKMVLSDKANSYPNRLSGGQQQRVAIMRALMMEPEVILFDEPTSALDPEMIGEVLSLFKTLAKSGTTMIISTHEIRFAREVSTKLLFLENGKIQEQGETNLCFTNPKTERFKRFLESAGHGEA